MDPMGKAMLELDRRGILDPYFWVRKLVIHSLKTFFFGRLCAVNEHIDVAGKWTMNEDDFVYIYIYIYNIYIIILNMIYIQMYMYISFMHFPLPC